LIDVKDGLNHRDTGIRGALAEGCLFVVEAVDGDPELLEVAEPLVGSGLVNPAVEV